MLRHQKTAEAAVGQRPTLGNGLTGEFARELCPPGDRPKKGTCIPEFRLSTRLMQFFVAVSA
jgi:hypothetical protein